MSLYSTLMLGVSGIVTLNRKEKRVYRTKRVILRAIGMTLSIFIVTMPGIIFPQYEEIKPTGKYGV